MSWPPELDDDWEDARPTSGATIGLIPDGTSDPHETCEGWRFDKLGLTKWQGQRLNKLARRSGTFASCQHDLARCVLLADLLEGDGDFAGNDLYIGPITRNVHVLARLRAS